MKTKKLFENVGGNNFKLLTESIRDEDRINNIREALKKVFINNKNKEISYKFLENLGLGYVKDVSLARRITIEEARVLAPHYGYVTYDDEQKFIKEDMEPYHSETNINNPEEKREVQIGRNIIRLIRDIKRIGAREEWLNKINSLASELIKMHEAEE